VSSSPDTRADGKAKSAAAARRLRVVTGEVPGPKSKALREQEAPHLAPGTQAISAYAGIVLDFGEGSEIVDVDGNRFLDLAAGICVAAIGYGHPRFTQEVSAQLQAIHVGSFTSKPRIRALEAISSLTPEGLGAVQLFSGGSEAVESAIRLARAFTGKAEILSFWGGFHGKTAGTLAQMGSEFKHHLGPLAPSAYLTPYADCARCPFKVKYPECGLLCVDFAREKLKKETTGELAAILVEPMQGTAGNIVPPPDWLPAIAQLAKENEALLIADEMITGFGRTGRPFAVERTNTKPDIMTVGKALAGGYPAAAVIARAEITRAEPWSKPSFSSSSYGGNPLASQAIASSIGIIKDEGLIENARVVGAHLKAGLERIAERHAFVENVRGEGLMLGFDLVDPKSGAPWSSDRCRKLFSAVLKRGMISMVYAPRVRVNPPLLFTKDQADEAIEILDGVLLEVT
jgi:4-aminobutyrate aminotransferase / (S)-3-amino-2-methylpropionate transaminase / 5-aminovalerate transaminase